MVTEKKLVLFPGTRKKTTHLLFRKKDALISMDMRPIDTTQEYTVL